MRMVWVPSRVGGDHVADDRPSLSVGSLVRGTAVERPAIVECGAAGRDLDRHELELDPGWHRARDMRQPVVGRVERAAERRMRPPVRAAHVVDRPGVGRRIVERHPARRHVRRIEMIEVRGVLMTQQRLSRRRLPDRVVLRQAQAGHGRQARTANSPTPPRQGRRPPARGRPSTRCTAGASAPARSPRAGS